MQISYFPLIWTLEYWILWTTCTFNSPEQNMSNSLLYLDTSPPLWYINFSPSALSSVYSFYFHNLFLRSLAYVQFSARFFSLSLFLRNSTDNTNIETKISEKGHHYNWTFYLLCIFVYMNGCMQLCI